MNSKGDFLKYSQKFWSKKYGRKLLTKEMKEMDDNLIKFP
jgi:hypothetical protein